MTNLYFIWGRIIEPFANMLARTRSESLTARMLPHLSKGASLLDIGPGTGHVALYLEKAGQCVEMINVVPSWGSVGEWLIGAPCATRLSRRDGIPFREYPGGLLPYPNGSYETCLVAFVLHHADAAEGLLAEAARVSSTRVILFEDIPKDAAEERYNHVADALANLEVPGTEHTTKSRDEWLAIFAKLNLRLVHEEEFVTVLHGMKFPNVMFVLEKI